MGQYADDVLDGLVDGQTGEVIDGEAPGYERRGDADPSGGFVERLRWLAEHRGMSLRKCCNTHYQVCGDKGPLINVWPTTGKYLEFDSAKGAKARRGTVEDIVARAAKLRLRRTLERKTPAPVSAVAPATADVDDDPFADNHPDSAPPRPLPPSVSENGCPPRDPVNHPPHYKLGTMEVIEAIEGLACGFHAGNVVKYVARYKAKGGVEDLKKARWYLERLIELECKTA